MYLEVVCMYTYIRVLVQGAHEEGFLPWLLASLYRAFLRNVGGCFSSVLKLGGHKLESYYI